MAPYFPAANMTFGLTRSISSSSQVRHWAISNSSGFLFPGGLTPNRIREEYRQHWSVTQGPCIRRSLPEPTNGTPLLSSFSPGASPTIIKGLFSGPEPSTIECRPAQSGQRRQPDSEAGISQCPVDQALPIAADELPVCLRDHEPQDQRLAQARLSLSSRNCVNVSSGNRKLVE
jgi:hypothetical protein